MACKIMGRESDGALEHEEWFKLRWQTHCIYRECWQCGMASISSLLTHSRVYQQTYNFDIIWIHVSLLTISIRTLSSVRLVFALTFCYQYHLHRIPPVTSAWRDNDIATMTSVVTVLKHRYQNTQSAH